MGNYQQHNIQTGSASSSTIIHNIVSGKLFSKCEVGIHCRDCLSLEIFFIRRIDSGRKVNKKSTKATGRADEFVTTKLAASDRSHTSVYVTEIFGRGRRGHDRRVKIFLPSSLISQSVRFALPSPFDHRSKFGSCLSCCVGICSRSQNFWGHWGTWDGGRTAPLGWRAHRHLTIQHQ